MYKVNIKCLLNILSFLVGCRYVWKIYITGKYPVNVWKIYAFWQCSHLGNFYHFFYPNFQLEGKFRSLLVLSEIYGLDVLGSNLFLIERSKDM